MREGRSRAPAQIGEVVISEAAVLIVVISLGRDQLRRQRDRDGAAEEARRGDRLPRCRRLVPHTVPRVQPPAIRGTEADQQPAGGQHREVDPRRAAEREALEQRVGPPPCGVGAEHLSGGKIHHARGAHRTCRAFVLGVFRRVCVAVCVF